MSIENKALSDRGFKGGEFKDRYGAVCSLQESSMAATEGDGEGHCIWLGLKEAEIHKDLRTGPGTVVKLDESYTVFSRMHLSQRNVSELIPHLQYFVETGWLPNEEQHAAFVKHLDDNRVQDIIDDFFSGVST